MDTVANNELRFRIVSFELIDKPPSSKKHLQSYTQDVAFVRIMGRTSDEKLVCLWLSGFNPYFFVQCPDHWTNYHAVQLREHLKDNIKNMTNNLVLCELQMSHALYGFSDEKLFPFIKLSFKGTRSMLQCRRYLDVS